MSESARPTIIAFGALEPSRRTALVRAGSADALIASMADLPPDMDDEAAIAFAEQAIGSAWAIEHEGELVGMLDAIAPVVPGIDFPDSSIEVRIWILPAGRRHRLAVPATRQVFEQLSERYSQAIFTVYADNEASLRFTDALGGALYAEILEPDPDDSDRPYLVFAFDLSK